MTLAEKLADAKAAFHDLVTGKKPRVLVDQNGEKIEFTVANRDALAAYIADLERQISGSGGGRAVRVWL